MTFTISILQFQVFEGTYDQNSVVNVTLNPPIYAKYIRINPQTWNNNIGLRFELIGCSNSQLMYCKYSLI